MRRPRGDRLLVLLSLIALACHLSACGVPSQDQPVVIDPTSVPNGLLATAEPEAESTPTPTPPARPVTYFVEADHLVGVERDLPAGTLQLRVAGAIHTLLTGPSEAEQAAGLGTAIPNGLLLTVAKVHDGEATIELTGELRNYPTTDNVLATAQIVLTATSQPTINRVRLTRDGKAVGAPLIGGTLKDTALTAADYEPLIARR